MSFSLFDSVPFDIWHQIASCLDAHDYINLSHAHPQFYSLLQNNGTARNVAKVTPLSLLFSFLHFHRVEGVPGLTPISSCTLHPRQR